MPPVSRLIPAVAMRWVGLVVLYLAVGLVQTAPLALHLTTSIPFGNDTVPTIARLNLWTLWWNADRLRHGYRGYWDAPIFYPERDALAYSEPQWLTGLVAAPLWWLTGNPALTYDAIVLLAFVLSGVGGYVVLRRLGVPFWPALGGGVITEMLATTSDQLGVLQSVTVVFPILMTLACLVEFGRSGRLRSAVGVGLGMAASFHSSSNMALFVAPPVALGFVVLAGHQLVRPRALVAVLLGVALAALLVAPVALVQIRVLAPMPRYDVAEIAGTSAHYGTYAQMAPTNLLRRRPPDRKEATLYPGTGLLALAALGAWYGIRRRRLRRWTVYAVLATLLCVLLSFGPLLTGILDAPYRILLAYDPGFGLARNLWRFGALAQLFLATLGGLGLAAFSAGRRRRAALGWLAMVAVAIDLLATPIPLLDLGQPPEWIHWLRDTPPDTTLIHMPMPPGASAEDFARTTYWMDCQMYHGRRIANGYAAYIPSRTALLMQVMPGFPDAESLRALQYFGITHVVADAGWMTPERAAAIEAWKAAVVPERTTPEVA